MASVEVDLDRLLGSKEAQVLIQGRLELIDPSKNTKKFYEIRVEKNFENRDNPYSLVAYFGRIGSSKGRMEVKYEGDDLTVAENSWQRLLNAKKKKGYSLVSINNN